MWVCGGRKSGHMPVWQRMLMGIRSTLAVLPWPFNPGRSTPAVLSGQGNAPWPLRHVTPSKDEFHQSMPETAMHQCLVGSPSPPATPCCAVQGMMES